VFEVGVCGALDVQTASAYVVYSFVVDHDGYIRVFQ
jgi:hypothetical protein